VRAASEDRLNVICGPFGSRTDHEFEIERAERSQQCVELPCPSTFDIRNRSLAQADFCVELFLGQAKFSTPLTKRVSELKRSASNGFHIFPTTRQ
jgi:hypothetical protein